MNPNFPDLELHATDAFAAQIFNFGSTNVSTPITVPSTPDQNLLELAWRNGPVTNELNGEPSQPRSPAEAGSPMELFVADDEMLAWLHYQVEDYGNGGLHSLLVDFSLDGDVGSQIAEKEKMPPATEAATVAESNATPAAAAAAAEERDAVVAGDEDSSFPVSSSSSSGASGEEKRKATEGVAPDSRSEDTTDSECGGKNRSKPSRRRRDAEVHNKSERRRRNKIKGKLKALLELIPSSRISCKKTDQLSTLDETIDYMRSLKVQAQILGMRMMYTGVPTYYPSMGMGMAPMGMAMGMNAGMTVPPDMGSGDGSGGGRPFPNVVPGPPVAGPPMAFFVPPHMMPVMRPSSMPIVDQFRAQGQQDQAMSFVNFMHVPGGGASFYGAPHHLHASSQAQVMTEPQAPKESVNL